MTAQVAPIARAALDVESMLAPISAAQPAGEWLRFDPTYDEIQKLRHEDDASLPQGIWQRELKRADWNAVETLCVAALTIRTKDLQIAAWLTEAWLHLHGFNGLAAGARLMSSLCDAFWEDLYPALEPDSCEYRVAPVAWLNRLNLALQSLPLTRGTSDEPMAYGWRHWEESLRLAKISVKDPQAAVKAEKSGAVTQAKFLVAMSLTPATWYASLDAELTAAIHAVRVLDVTVTERCGERQAPSLAPLRDLLLAIQALVTRVLRERIDKGELSAAVAAPEPPVEEPMSEQTTPTHAVPAAAAGVVAGAIASRADAYRAMTEAAEFLMRTEPHSPVPYLVRRAISWGNMSLVELLDELLQKNADVNTIYALLGMKRPG